MYGRCMNESVGLRFFNLEIVATALSGVYPCASSDGRSALLHTGWSAAAPCTCNNSRGLFLHCDEVPFSGRLEVEPSFQHERMMMMSGMRG